MFTVIKLDGVDAAALEIVASYEGVSPERVVRDLVRQAALSLVTHPARRQQPALMKSQPESKEILETKR